jgi:cell division septum initiation protein DivIVA/anthranilate/para-aminobenzoate synthase component II
MGSEESTETATTDTSSSMTAFEVPDNVDFVLNTSITSLLYDNLEIKNAKGSVVIRDGSVDLTGFSMQVLDGTITMKGTYATKNSPVPVVNLGFNMVDVDIKKTYDAFTTLQKQAPILGKCSGRVSITLDYQGNLTSTMEPDMATVNGFGRLKTKSITVDNASVFNKLSEFVKSDKYKTLKFDNVDLAFTIKDGNIELEPMKTKFGKSEFEFGGKQSLDQALDYFMNIKIPSSELGAKANEIFAGMSNTASQLGVNIKVPEVIDVKGLIEGTVLEPKLKFNLKDQVNNVVEDVKEQVKEKINEEIDKAKEEAIKKAQEQADKLLKEADAAGQKLIAAAEQSAAQIRANAKTAADKIRSEADTQAQNLINQAKGKGFIAEKAAKESAEKIKKEAYKKATELENTANNESNNVINKAKTESENLKKKAKEEGDKLIEAARK